MYYINIFLFSFALQKSNHLLDSLLLLKYNRHVEDQFNFHDGKFNTKKIKNVKVHTSLDTICINKSNKMIKSINLKIKILYIFYEHNILRKTYIYN